MAEHTQAPQIEILSREQPPSHPDSVVIREFDLPKYYVEQTKVVLEPQLDSTLIVVHMEGELKHAELTTPTYSFRTASGHTVTASSDAGVLQTRVS